MKKPETLTERVALAHSLTQAGASFHKMIGDYLADESVFGPEKGEAASCAEMLASFDEHMEGGIKHLIAGDFELAANHIDWADNAAGDCEPFEGVEGFDALIDGDWE